MHPGIIALLLMIYLRAICCPVVSIPGERFCSKPVYQCVKKIVLESSLDLIKAKLDFIARKERKRTKGREGGGCWPDPVPADWFLVP